MNPPPPTLRAVIVGTGRSGSGYIARALTACGIPCGHEQVWGFGKVMPGQVVESSWMAGRFLPLPFATWHQVRHPEAVLRSRITAPKKPQGKYQAEIVRDGWFPLTGDDVLDAMRRYVIWNLMCEHHATRRWRVEDVNAALIEDLADEIGMADVVDPTGLAAVTAEVNRHTRPDVVWTLDDLPAGADRDAVLRMGERYGYW